MCVCVCVCECVCVCVCVTCRVTVHKVVWLVQTTCWGDTTHTQIEYGYHISYLHFSPF